MASRGSSAGRSSRRPVHPRRPASRARGRRTGGRRVRHARIGQPRRARRRVPRVHDVDRQRRARTQAPAKALRVRRTRRPCSRTGDRATRLPRSPEHPAASTAHPTNRRATKSPVRTRAAAVTGALSHRGKERRRSRGWMEAPPERLPPRRAARPGAPNHTPPAAWGDENSLAAHSEDAEIAGIFGAPAKV
jgi:hypothetical protein